MALLEVVEASLRVPVTKILYVPTSLVDIMVSSNVNVRSVSVNVRKVGNAEPLDNVEVYVKL